jgi:predicted anti-sigma-YlaC factor YlaD
MTCAEARRQLPAPEAVHAAAVAAHLADCNPCRAEHDALKEVDRRLQRLGQARVLKAQPALGLLTERAQAQLGLPLPVPRARPRWLLLLCGLVALGALWWWRAR